MRSKTLHPDSCSRRNYPAGGECWLSPKSGEATTHEARLHVHRDSRKRVEMFDDAVGGCTIGPTFGSAGEVRRPPVGVKRWRLDVDAQPGMLA